MIAQDGLKMGSGLRFLRFLIRQAHVNFAREESQESQA